jgi:hypothetical protein
MILDLPPVRSLPRQPDLPDPLARLDGSRVVDAAGWPARRAELATLVQHYEYGYLPPPVPVTAAPRFTDSDALDGAATLTELDLQLGDAPRPVRLLLAIPNTPGRHPLFVGANFDGNHTLLPDERISIPTDLVATTSPERNTQPQKWPLRQIVQAGWAVATVYGGDLDLDDASVRDAGIRPYVDTLPAQGPNPPGSIAVWAWGLHRVLDALADDDRLDAGHAVAIGHSRYGKVALLAAGFDPRFAAAIPHQAGGGSTSPARTTRDTAEQPYQLAERFPHWFTPAYADAGADPTRLPFDQHALLALMAPRPVLLSNATEDLWADPVGQLATRRAAEPVYRLLGDEPDWHSGRAELPAVGELLPGSVGFWLRPGAHSVTSEDWQQFIAFADAQRRG